MPIYISITNETSIQLLYSSKDFVGGLSVTGYLIYPDLTKTSVIVFDELGDGIYVGVFPNEHLTDKTTVRYGVVVKENGITAMFEFLTIST